MGESEEYSDIGEWSQAKLEIVWDYGKEYSKILAKQELLSHAYIDAFASPGVHILCTTGEMVAGSPVNPTGRLPSRQWRPLAWIAGISGAVLFAPFRFSPPSSCSAIRTRSEGRSPP